MINTLSIIKEITLNMCGVIGYIGKKSAAPILLTGLKRMEYRGYDSTGIATLETSGVIVSKKQGQVVNLEAIVDISRVHRGSVGIGHTRWATHGAPSDTNAHPHTKGRVTLIHNGIFENYKEFKSKLATYTYTSETDSEVLAALIDSLYTNDPKAAVLEALKHVRGTYGLVVLFDDQPNTLVVARRSSPILIAKDGDSIFVASDQYALAGRAAQAIVLNDEEVALCTPGSIEITSMGNKTSQEVIDIDDSEESTKEGYPHYMLKEIFEQPESLRRVLSGRLFAARGSSQLGGINLSPKQLRGVRSLVLVGCGTAYNAGMTAKYLLEPLLKIPISVEIASELRYRNVALSGHELAIAISQSGETADTIACIDELQLKGIPVLGVVNVVGSTIARMVDGGVYTHAGPEISVASTKAFTAQVTALLLIGLYMARQRAMTLAEGLEFIQQLDALPEYIQQALALDKIIKKQAQRFAKLPHLMILGRDTLYPIALETTLKIKELSYIPTTGYAAGEMKHGPNALLANDMGVVFFLGDNDLYEKSLSNLAEVTARGAKVIVITDRQHYDGDAVLLPKSSPLQQPYMFTIAGQLLSYHLAVILKRNVDKPRNLAKSVTVE